MGERKECSFGNELWFLGARSDRATPLLFWKPPRDRSKWESLCVSFVWFGTQNGVDFSLLFGILEEKQYYFIMADPLPVTVFLCLPRKAGGRRTSARLGSQRCPCWLVLRQLDTS